MIFIFGKKKDKETAACNRGTEEQPKIPETKCCVESEKGGSRIKVLGAGCKSCHEQYENSKEAVKSLGIDVEVEYITDMQQVIAYGAISMPAIVVNEKVVAMGKVLKTADVKRLLQKFNF